MDTTEKLRYGKNNRYTMTVLSDDVYAYPVLLADKLALIRSKYINYIIIYILYIYYIYYMYIYIWI